MCFVVCSLLSLFLEVEVVEGGQREKRAVAQI